MTVRMNVVGGGVIANGKLVPFVADRGEPGPVSTTPGPGGDDGWTPILAGELDGVRTLIKVVDWTGGEGAKPLTGMYIGTTGYVATKAEAFNFNQAKRVFPMSAVTAAGGIATFNLSSLNLANIPSIVPLPATTAVISGPTRTTIQSSPAVSKTSATVKVEGAALLTGIVTALVGSTANILVIEQ